MTEGSKFNQLHIKTGSPFTLALSIPDEEQPDNDERWVTLGRSTEDKTLLVVHTYRENTNNSATIRIISARKATKHEQRQHEATT